MTADKKFPAMNYVWMHSTGGGWHKEYPTFQTKNCEFAEPGTNNCLYNHPCEYREAEFCRQKLPTKGTKGLEKKI